MILLLMLLELLACSATVNVSQIQAECKQDVALQCEGNPHSNHSDRTVTWYKCEDLSKCDSGNGIIRKKGSNLYTFLTSSREGMDIRDDWSLFLPAVTPDDSGFYKCKVGAKIGEQTYESYTNLTVLVCVTPPPVTSSQVTEVTCVTNVTTEQPAASRQDEFMMKSDEDEGFPVTWCVVGFVALPLVKIILSVATVKIVGAISERSWRGTEDSLSR